VDLLADASTFFFLGHQDVRRVCGHALSFSTRGQPLALDPLANKDCDGIDDRELGSIDPMVIGFVDYEEVRHGEQGDP